MTNEDKITENGFKLVDWEVPFAIAKAKSTTPYGDDVLAKDIGNLMKAAAKAQFEQTLKDMVENGIHGYPGGDHECFVLWDEPNCLEHGHDWRWKEKHWKYPSHLTRLRYDDPTNEEPGTLVWIPDSLLQAFDIKAEGGG